MFTIPKQPPVKQALSHQLLKDQFASVQQLSLKIIITNIFGDWTRSVLELQNCNNFAGC